MSTGPAQSDPGSAMPSRQSAVPDASAVGAASPGLMDSIFAATRRDGGEARSRLDQFLAEPSSGRALKQWVTWSTIDGMTPDGSRIRLDRDRLIRLLGRDVARLDVLISGQVNAILHHPRFQKLEASWRGLQYLAEQAEDGEDVKIRVLGVSWKELARDAQRAIEFDQSQLFRKVYSEEYDTPGGEPFGVLVGDYEIRHRPSADHPIDDVSTLQAISQVAAAAFAPFVAGVHPAMFGLDHFTGLEQPLDPAKVFEQTEYLKWKAFRDTEDARFVGLTLPRVLMRLPHEDDGSRVDGFGFHEDVSGPDRSKYLWGNAAYALGGVLIRAFEDSRWLADIRGVRRDVNGGGLVPSLPVHSFSTDKEGVAPKCSTDVIITDAREPELSALGFIPLCHCRDTEYSAFYTNQSVQKPKRYDDPAATANAGISAMLQYILCISQFSHYVKVISRDKIGTFSEAEECEDYLYRWLQKYVTADADASPEVRAELPLREARVQVRPHPGKPGTYMCVAHLWPHFELDELTTAIRVNTELAPGRSN